MREIGSGGYYNQHPPLKFGRANTPGIVLKIPSPALIIILMNIVHTLMHDNMMIQVIVDTDNLTATVDAIDMLKAEREQHEQMLQQAADLEEELPADFWDQHTRDDDYHDAAYDTWMSDNYGNYYERS